MYRIIIIIADLFGSTGFDNTTKLYSTGKEEQRIWMRQLYHCHAMDRTQPPEFYSVSGD